MCFDETISPPGLGEVVQSKVEQLILEGLAKVGKEGSVCQAAGWGYPWLTTLPPSLASANTVNEIPSLTQLADIQWRETETERERGFNCVLIFYLHVFTSSTPFLPSAFILKWKIISSPATSPKPVPPCLLLPSLTLCFCLNYIFISYLTLSTIFSTLTGEDIHHQ